MPAVAAVRRTTMSPGLRRTCALALVVFGAIYVAWLGFRLELMGDYPQDYAPAMNDLLSGHLGAFFAHLPTNGAGGSIVIRAPAALVGKLLVGSQLAEFRFGALLCVLVAGALGLRLARELRDAGQSPFAGACVTAICVLSPAVLDAIFFGHPEEPVGAALCVAAVLLAGGGHSAWAGVFLGLALINKPWGVLAVGPVLLCARTRRLELGLIVAAVCMLWTGLAYAADPAHFGRVLLGSSTSVVAHPVDLWWPLAHLHQAPGVTPAYFPPQVVSAHARELAVLMSVPLSLLVLRRRKRSVADCLALLALLFLLRCALDPSNHVYYQVPAVIALAAWEARLRQPPLIALGALAGFWLVFHLISGTGSLTAQFVSYLMVALPVATALVASLARPDLSRPAARWRDAPALG